MAEVELIEEEITDTDTLPDGVETEETSILVLDNLDEGNLIEQVENPTELAGDIRRLYDHAYASMKSWRKKYKRAMKMAKMEPEAEEKTFPFQNASNVMMPFILETMLDFHSRTVPELVWTKKPVGIETYGKNNDAKTARAERMGVYMNYQVTKTIKQWRDEQDKLLLQLPCVGTGYKETYFDGDLKEAASDLLQADELVFDQDSKTFDEAPNYFVKCEFSRNDVIERIRGDAKWQLNEIDFPLEKDHPEGFKFIRAFIWHDLDGDGLSEPYRAIYYEEKEQLCALYPAYDEEGITDNDDGEIVKIERMNIFTQYRFLPDPEGGPMGLGWGILLGDMFDAINSTFNQLIDAGTLANLAGSSGLIESNLSPSGRGNRQQAGPIDVRMGELTPVTTGGKSLRESIIQFPYQGPNGTLMQLTEYMVEQMRNMTNAAVNMDTNGQEAAIMYLARLQQGLKIPNSIVMRVYAAAANEFSLIAAINFKHHDSVKYNCVLDEETEYNMRADFNPETCDVGTAIDPSQGTDIERTSRADLILQEAKEDSSNILDKRAAYLEWLDALNVPDPERIAPEPSGEPSMMEKLTLANLQREASVEDRRLRIDEVKLELERLGVAMRATKEMMELGLEGDMKQAQITREYAEAFKLLWEIGAAGDDPTKTVQEMERRLIDQQAPLIEMPKPVELALQEGQPEPQQGQQPPPGAAQM